MEQKKCSVCGDDNGMPCTLPGCEFAQKTNPKNASDRSSVNDKKYGDPDFGCTLAELKQHAELAQTVQGVSFEGNARKVGAILAVAGAGSELIAEIEKLQQQRDELVAVLDELLQSGTVFSSAIEADDVMTDFEKWEKKARSLIAAAKGGAA